MGMDADSHRLCAILLHMKSALPSKLGLEVTGWMGLPSHSKTPAGLCEPALDKISKV